MKKRMKSQKHHFFTFSLWALVLVVFFTLQYYHLTPTQALREAEDAADAPRTRVLEKRPMEDGVALLSANEVCLFYSNYTFSPLRGWSWNFSAPNDLSHMDGPVYAARCSLGNGSGSDPCVIYGVTTLDNAAAVRAYDPRMSAILEGPVETVHGISYFWLEWEGDLLRYPILSFLDREGKELFQYAINDEFSVYENEVRPWILSNTD